MKKPLLTHFLTHHKVRFLALCLLLALWLCPLADASPKTSPPNPPKLWQLTQHHSDIRTFIAQVASITGDTFVLDPDVKGNNISVVSSKLMTKQQIYDVFLSVLNANGLTAIPQKNQIRITLTAKGKQLGSQYGALHQYVGYLATQVIPLIHISALEAAPAVQPLIAADGQVAAVPSSNALVITDTQTNLQRIVRLIRQMDRDTASGFTVISLKHTFATRVATIILNSLKSRAPQSIDLTQVIADESSNRIIVFGDTGRRQQIRQLIQQLDIPTHTNNAALVINLRYADAKKLATILQKVSQNLNKQATTYGTNRSPLKGSVVVEADTSQNALVIVADSETQQQLAKLVHQLDAKRDQILLETAIVEFSGDADQALGVQWALSGLSTQSSSGESLAGGTFTNNTIGSVTGYNPGALQLGTIALRNQTFGVLVSALATRSNTNLLSTPSLLTLDNQKASIFVGQERSFETGSYTGSNTGNSDSSFSNPFTTVDRKQVGLTVKVTPHINSGGSMRLDIEQKVQNVVPDSNQPPGQEVVSDRELKTSVLVDNKQTIVLGGLLSDYLSSVRSKVPLLGDIPWLGRLFRYDSKKREKRNLMIFIRPTLISAHNNGDTMTYDKYHQLMLLSRHQDKNDFAPLEVPKTPEQLFNVQPKTPQAVDLRNTKPERNTDAPTTSNP